MNEEYDTIEVPDKRQHKHKRRWGVHGRSLLTVILPIVNGENKRKKKPKKRKSR